MKETRRKNAAGSWLRWEMQRQVFSVGTLAMAGIGFGLGFTLRGLPILDALDGTIAAWGMVAVMVLVGGALCGALYRFGRRIESTWRAGWDAERRVGDVIEHALVEHGCAFAHDVKEALGGSGNIDHVVMTPAGVRVVETKAHRLESRRFPAALAQAANNARRVRRHLKTSLPVRAALVIGERTDSRYESDRDSQGEPVKVFDEKTFWRVLREERRQGCAVECFADSKRIERMVWDLGSSRHIET